MRGELIDASGAKTARLQLRVPVTLADELESRALAEGGSLSGLTRRLVILGLRVDDAARQVVGTILK